MVNFIDRDSVLTWITFHSSRRGVIRAIEEGRVEHLGGFRYIKELGRSGWICRVTSEYGRVWIVACGTNGTLKYLKAVPWNHYVGSVGATPLYSGDNPKIYLGFRRLSYFEQKHKQTPSEHRTDHSCENDSPTDEAPLNSTYSVPVWTRLSVGIKNLWQRLF